MGKTNHIFGIESMPNLAVLDTAIDNSPTLLATLPGRCWIRPLKEGPVKRQF